MIKRTIYIGNSAYLKCKNQQMLIIDPESKVTKAIIPVEDIAMLMLDHYQITISHQLIIKLQANNTIIVSCDAHHLPFAIMLPMAGHVEYSERLKTQINITEPLKKQLWKQTVESKISQQLLLLKKLNKSYESMGDYLNQVKSGDSTNMEGIAAQFYWKNLLDNFNRERNGDFPNNLLNFGYAVLRSIVARALVSSGLNPTLGIFHKNKYNAHCLADDIMEPYRPYVDEMVYQLMLSPNCSTELTQNTKAYLLKIATQDVVIAQKNRPLMVAVSTTTASYYKCLSGENRVIRYPTLC